MGAVRGMTWAHFGKWYDLPVSWWGSRVGRGDIEQFYEKVRPPYFLKRQIDERSI